MWPRCRLTRTRMHVQVYAGVLYVRFYPCKHPCEPFSLV